MKTLAGLCLIAVSIHAQDFENLQAERVATNLTNLDGMVWSRQGFLVFSDVAKKRIYRLDANKPPQPTDEDGNGTEGLAYDAMNRLYVCEPLLRRVVRIDNRGKHETLAESFQGKKFNSPNDIAVRKDGQIYFTDPAFGSQQDARELDFFGVYHVSRKGLLGLVAKWKTRPNGIALSPSGHLLYVANSDERSVLAYDLDKAGEASGERVFASHIAGVPNGVRVDEKGNVYVAAKDVSVYTSEGKALIQIPVADGPSNLAFGDPDFGTLYITARTAVYRVRLDVKGAIQY